MKIRALIDTILYKLKSKKNARSFRKRAERIRKEILNYYSQNLCGEKDIENAVEYLKTHPLTILPGNFAHKYNYQDIEVFTDESNGLRYVFHKNKRLYFKRSYNIRTIQYLYSGLLAEQDKESPHCYTDEAFRIQTNDILFDIGSAEGIFPLSHIEEIKKAVLFERDPEWTEALEATFRPWKEKVEIISRYVSDEDNAENIKIDSFISRYSYTPHFIKIDVEGAELKVLKGMEYTIKSLHPRIAVCTYHKPDDFRELSNHLTASGYTITPSQGVMIFFKAQEDIRTPYFRKGLIRAFKKQILPS